MATFKIATWNINSLRVRLPHVLAWLAEVQPDVLTLQELKIPETDFPFDVIKAAGYTAKASCQKTYNGVAVLTRDDAAQEIQTDFPGFDDHQRRVLAVTYQGIRIVNLYVPNGESVVSEKYQYKLNWLYQLDKYLKQELMKHGKVIVLGDFNIAPAEIDVHNPKRWEGQVLFSEPERKAFQDLLNLGLQDCFRKVNPEAEKAFSWWDYRLRSFERNMGLRIDHILASSALACEACYIDKAPRAQERPSDHAPVVAVFSM